mmetsp:Transcript_75999/g.176316  ORF Transcript_75999/g.176316 Transcript_75999/m.176316 type:complete len:236 (-) Transcript_75999:81-788(-)
MSPPSMTLLQLEPDNTLHFCKAPNSTALTRTLKLTNVHSSNVAFKVKTTAPKAYLVRPSSGTLKPREPQEVQIILQPPGADQQAFNHRFLVQAIAVSTAEPVTREMWAEFPKESIQEQRLNVMLEELSADSAATSKPAPAVTASAHEATPAAVPTAVAAVGATASEQPTDLKVKYEELVQYTLMLEKEKKRLEADMVSLQAAKSSGVGDSGFSKFQVIIVAVLAFLLSYVAKLLG